MRDARRGREPPARSGAFPTGREACGTTPVLLPAAAPATWRNALTGEEIAAVRGRSGGATIPLAAALRTLPAAVLAGGSLPFRI
ncbi:MAG: hypothetical protein FJ087_23350 [Deltaproteobacteria bacterium]|nr:hypothetical protein [Deltaproteobacteria bacterium]